MAGPQALSGSRHHHELELHELVLLLETDRERGLTAREAHRRREVYGPNQLPEAAGVPWWRRVLRQLHSPLIYVLLVATVVTFLLEDYVDSAVILGVVVLNTLMGYVQETKAESALAALRSMSSTRARVVRDGAHLGIPSEELVPGDLVQVEAGDKLPADLRVVAQSELQVDESALTGESLPVAKEAMVLPARTPVADRRNMAYSGTLVTSGTGTGVVVATGVSTELGEIHRLVGGAKDLATPLTRKIATFSTYLTVVILALAAITFGIGVGRGESGSAMFIAAVALAVGMIPEGLPAAITVMLAIGVSRMARRGAVIRRLPAVETLGGATVICSDKTGTLTQNRMTVRALWSPGSGEVAVEDVAADHALLERDRGLRWCVLAGSNCNDSTLGSDGAGVGDPTEIAMLVCGEALGVAPHQLPRTGSVPFASERQWMATAHQDPDGGRGVVLVKGAVERVLDLCVGELTADGAVRPVDADAVHAAVHALAAHGMRVLATAVALDRDADALADTAGAGLVLSGLQAMLDPPRETATAAVRACHDAGLSVKMITGDHAGTATAIARMMGIIEPAADPLADPADAGRVLTGADLDRLADDVFAETVERADVFARVSPEQKLRLVEALQSRHHVVAMTGDGVNDAPALRQADIGIAMGLGGTEVAKEAGDMVLTDDDFATIEAAVEEGRGVFDNLTKFIVWTLPTNLGEGLIILVAIFLGSQLPILPTQILWINMTTAVALGITLAWEPKERGIMTRPPRDPRANLLTGTVVLRTLLVALVIVAGAWWVFDHELSSGASLDASRTAALNLVVVVEIFYLFGCRSLTGSVWQVGFFSNKWVLVGVTAQVLGQLAITYVPVMQTLFRTAPIAPTTWLMIVAVAALSAVVVALDKKRAAYAARRRTLPA